MSFHADEAARMAHVSFSDLKRSLTKHLDQVERDRLELVVKRRGHEDMVIMPLSEWAGMHETMCILESPLNAQRLREGITQLDAGQGIKRNPIEP